MAAISGCVSARRRCASTIRGSRPCSARRRDDFREGKITLPVVLCDRRGNERERGFWQRTLREGAIREEDLLGSHAPMQKHDALSDTMERARDYGAIAVTRWRSSRRRRQGRCCCRPSTFGRASVESLNPGYAASQSALAATHQAGREAARASGVLSLPGLGESAKAGLLAARQPDETRPLAAPERVQHLAGSQGQALALPLEIVPRVLHNRSAAEKLKSEFLGACSRRAGRETRRPG